MGVDHARKQDLARNVNDHCVVWNLYVRSNRRDQTMLDQHGTVFDVVADHR